METNPISGSKKYFRCICLNSVGTALSVGRIFSKHSIDEGKHNAYEEKHNIDEGKHSADKG